MKTKKILLILTILFICTAIFLISRFNLLGISPKISPPSSQKECLRLAKQYLEKDEPESAIYPLLLAIQKDEDDPESHLLLAQVYYRLRVLHLAEKECKISLELDPQDREALELLCQIRFDWGRSSFEKKDFSQAIPHFAFILEKSQNQELLDSIAHLTGGRLKMTRLTNDLFYDDAPSFSPDGKRIIYHSDSSYFLEDYGLEKIQVKKSRIFIMDVDGNSQMCLSPQNEEEPSECFGRFSHDGRYIVYEKENNSPHISDTIFNCDRDIFIQDLKTGKEERLTHNDTYDGLPSFSPDDSQIVFVSDRPGGGGICTLNLKTREIKNISLKESWDEKIGFLRRYRRMIMPYCPSFSPDGKKVLLHSGWEVRGIFLYDISDRSWRGLTDRKTDCFFPTFSSDGERIVFVSGHSDEQDLYVMDKEGGSQTRLTFNGGLKRYPSFSPDGKSIVFAGKRKEEPDNYFEIYLLHLDQTISKEKLKERLKEVEETSSAKAPSHI